MTIRLRERRPNGNLVGIMLDDQRNPKQRVTLLAEQGELVDSNGASFWSCRTALCSGRRPNERDPAMVRFDRYAFDLSQFSGGSQEIKYSIRERYLWQLLFPDPKDPLYLQQPGQFRAELHDRLIAPLYPLAFAVIAFAYLGAPRTTRQSRTMSLLGAIGGVASAAPDRIRLDRIRREHAVDAVTAVHRDGGGVRLRPVCHSTRYHHRAACLHRSDRHRRHRTNSTSASPRREHVGFSAEHWRAISGCGFSEPSCSCF